MREQYHLKYGWRLRTQFLVNSELGDERREMTWVGAVCSFIFPSARPSMEHSHDRRGRHGWKRFQNFHSLYHVFNFLSYSFNSPVLYLVESVFPPNIYPSLRRIIKKISLFLLGSLGTTATMHGQEVYDSSSTSKGTNGHWWPSSWEGSNSKDRNSEKASQNVENHTRCHLCLQTQKPLW